MILIVDLLTASLAALAQVDDTDEDETTSQLSERAIENILRHSSTIWDLESAVHMLHLIRSLAAFSNSAKTSESVGKNNIDTIHKGMVKMISNVSWSLQEIFGQKMVRLRWIA